METIDLMETMVTLVAKNHQLQQENSRMHNSMFSLVKENFELKSMIQNKDARVDSTAGKSTSCLWSNTCDESQFLKDLKQSSAAAPKTSSPTTTFLQSSSHKVDNVESKTSQGYFPQDPKRILGEVALQLDRRILSHVFQGHKRRYGFTISNIPVKIKEVSLHPLTKQVNEDYERHLTRRPGSLTLEYNNPKFLKKLIMTEAPQNLQNDLVIVLNCLCFMAEKYKRNLFKW